MKKVFISSFLALFCLTLTWAYATQPIMTPPLLHISAPASGESWLIGQTKTISWTSSNIIGNATIFLYRGGTSSSNLVGTVALAVPVATGKYVWTAGKHLAGTAAPGGGYLIAIKTAGSSNLKMSAPFTLAAMAQGMTSSAPTTIVKPPAALKMIVISRPHRGELLYKGIPFTITWSATNLGQTRLKIQLTNVPGTTVVRDIVKDIADTGEYKWYPPMDLPDEKILYKIRIQTLDGTMTAASNSFYIAKATSSSNARILELKHPPAGDRYMGDTVPVRWTTTINCSAAGGPTDEAFFIDLMDESGSHKVRTLADSVAGFVKMEPQGILNWRWDWIIDANQQPPGTYRISVRNWNQQCADKSDKIRIFLPRKTHNFRPVQISACPRAGAQLMGFSSTYEQKMALLGLTEAGVSGPPNQGLVGISVLKDKLGNTVDNFVVRSWLRFNNDPFWYKKLGGRIIEARLILNQVWKLTNPTFGACLEKVMVLGRELTNCSEYYVRHDDITLNANQGTLELNLTGAYAELTKENNPDHGVMLYIHDYNLTGHPGPKHYRNAETYDAVLRVVVESAQP